MQEQNRLSTPLDITTLIEQDLGRPRQKGSRWSLWFCPFHPDQKSPSLGANRQNGSWHCFGCGKGGDGIAWLQAYRKLRYKAASDYLGQASYNESTPMMIDPVYEPSPHWQARAQAFVQYAIAQLWQNPQALAYLRELRLLEDNTIRHFCLGYNPVELWDRPERWGMNAHEIKRIWLPQGIVIPGFVEKALWYIKIRQLDREPKYVHVRGSIPALFGADSLLGTPLILLTEGEFDCMLTWQLLRDIAGVATLGSANKKLDLTRWTRYLLPAEEIIAVLDNDIAGKFGAQTLAGLSAQIHPVRIPSLTPQGKDITDYVQAGGDLWEWLKRHLAQIECPDFKQ